MASQIEMRTLKWKENKMADPDEEGGCADCHLSSKKVIFFLVAPRLLFYPLQSFEFVTSKTVKKRSLKTLCCPMM